MGAPKVENDPNDTERHTKPVSFRRQVYVGDDANGNQVIGLTLNMLDELAGQIQALKSNLVDTGLTTLPGFDVETDDFYTVNKLYDSDGGVSIEALGDVQPEAYFLSTFAQGSNTDDGLNSLAMENHLCQQHDGANAGVDFPVDGNAFMWGVRLANGTTRRARMLLKGDDGELHLGNTTLVALDGEDDLQLVRTLQRANHGGRGMVDDEWEKPIYNFDSLREMGVVGPKNEEGQFLIRVQPYLALHDGSIWKLAKMVFQLQKDNLELLGRLDALGPAPGGSTPPI